MTSAECLSAGKNNLELTCHGKAVNHSKSTKLMIFVLQHQYWPFKPPCVMRIASLASVIKCKCCFAL